MIDIDDVPEIAEEPLKKDKEAETNEVERQTAEDMAMDEESKKWVMIDGNPVLLKEDLKKDISSTDIEKMVTNISLIDSGDLPYKKYTHKQICETIDSEELPNDVERLEKLKENFETTYRTVWSTKDTEFAKEYRNKRIDKKIKELKSNKITKDNGLVFIQKIKSLFKKDS